MSRGSYPNIHFRRPPERSVNLRPTLTLRGLVSLETGELLVIQVNDQLKEFQEAIGDPKAAMADIVKILSKLVSLAGKRDSPEIQSIASKIIAEVLSERSDKFHNRLNRAVQCMLCTIDQAESFCNLFKSMLTMFESLAMECLPIDEVHETIKRLTKDGSINSDLLIRAQKLCEARDLIRSSYTQEKKDKERDDSQFRLVPVFPEWNEIKEDNGIPPEVRPNRIDDPYKDWMEYYDIQFRLIREDFIAPLRRGVASFLQGDRGRDVKIYSAANIMHQVTTKEKGVCFMVKFDVSGFTRINPKRLIFGSLLCFIPKENIETNVLFATVAQCNTEYLREGKIMVHFEGDVVQVLQHCQVLTEFYIIESSAYFEATGPILRSLQKGEVDTMPFTRVLIEGKCDAILPPTYLRNKNAIYNLSCLRARNDQRPMQHRARPPLRIEVLKEESWELARDTELDSSQLNAIQTALTQEIAVIQGPPGTGKTYIGLKIVEGLLQNRHIWDPHRSTPILVMCYTNHALDQFLEGIIDTKCCDKQHKVIRIGGRCKNEKVYPHILKKIRKNTHHSDEISKLEDELKFCNPQRALVELQFHYKRTRLLSLRDIKTVADPYHYYQLMQIVKCKEQKGNEIEVWLGLWTAESRERHLKGKQGKKRNTAEYLPSKMKNTVDLAILSEDEIMNDSDEEGYQVVDCFKHEEPHSLVHYYEEYSDDESDFEEDTHRKPKGYRRSDADEIISMNLFKDNMDDEEASEADDITSLNNEDRWRLYNYWEEQRYKYLQEENRRLVQDYTEKCRELAELRQFEDRHILEEADVVGMTTTGAAKYQNILHHIKPKIVIVEEAAEVLEAHIVSALSAGTQHLILIGDHKQLRPKPNEYVLATKYNLSISLFERLVMKEMSQATLEIQHRMRPEIARLVCPHVYEKLLNHEGVRKYPDIRGISKNLFFVSHTQPESENPNLLSYENDFEAKYIAALCSHLLRLGYSPSQITILTPYVGQLLMLRNKMPKEEFEGVRVTAIDNFQGEENDIILFSMVRSTNPHSSRTTIGFVKEDNRVCVSLSRAKHGFYVIGNFELIRHQSPLWESIISDVESRGCYGKALPLYCCNHSKTKFSAEKDTDFSANAPNGGCKRMCDIRLPCGHSCTQMCHVTDLEHASFVCKKPCAKKCQNNHQCKSKHPCCEECPECNEITEITMPECGHKQMILCNEECLQEQQNEGYRLLMLYSRPKLKCREIVTKAIPRCGHEQSMRCSTNPVIVQCTTPCSKRCTNGHQCPKSCGENCGLCLTAMEKVIPHCNHMQMLPCYLKPDEAKCRFECEKLCPNGLHKMKKLCSEKWPQCKEKVTKTIPKCGHKVEALCFEDPSTILCHKPCERFCGYGHKCSKPCHKNCTPCLFKVTKNLECGHTCILPCPQAYNDSFKCRERCQKIKCERGHFCPKTCHYPTSCEPCEKPVAVRIPTCSHEQSLKCYMSSNPEKYGYICKYPCIKRLHCSHKCTKQCGQTCQSVCMKSVNIELECGHHTKVKCHRKSRKEFLVENCKKHVKVKLFCGHTIHTDCWRRDYKSVLSKECTKSCRRTLTCGHNCQEKCGNPCTVTCTVPVKERWPCGHELVRDCYQTQEKEVYPCNRMCSKKLLCGHTCQNTCGNPCSMCNLKSTRHYPCGHLSKIPCNAPIEEYPCKKKCKVVLSCGHRCSAKCGDCYSSRIHAVCSFEIKLRRFCGHSLTLPCAGLSDSCDHGTHQVPCTHGEDYSKCGQLCSWDCKHYQCERECGEECDRPPCNEACDKELSCGHSCPGLCGERCTTVCVECEPQKFMKQFHPKPKKGHLPRDEPFFELGCCHIFTVPYLDEYMGNSGGAVLPKQCPKCHQNIGVGSRYGNAVRRAQSDITQIQARLEENSDINLSDDSLNSLGHVRYVTYINKLLLSPRSSERNCLVQAVNMSMAIFCKLQKYNYLPEICSIRGQMMELTLTLINSSIRKHLPKGVKQQLTFQLLNDFKSELYRLALCALWLSLKSRYTPTEVTSRIKFSFITAAEKQLSLINPLKGRISEEDYERYFNAIEQVAPDMADLHVQTPHVPPPVKGEWRKCSRGHYFCVPYVCGRAYKLPVDCPDCKE